MIPHSDTTLGKISNLTIIENINVADGHSFFIYFANEVRMVMCKNIQLYSQEGYDGSVESIKRLIKQHPEEEITVFNYNSLEGYFEFEDVVKQMKLLTKTYNREDKLNELLDE